MNTCLLFHPYSGSDVYWIPFSLLSIGSALKAKGYKVIIIDQNLDEYRELTSANVLSILDSVLPETILVGISSFTGPPIQHGLQFAQLVKDRRDVPVVWGGWHPSLLPNLTIEHPLVDYVIRGQGETTITELATYLCNSSDQKISAIEGLTYKNAHTIHVNTDRTPVARQFLPPYDWSLIEIDPYIRDDKAINTKTINYVSSQGCPHNCGFCSDIKMYKRKWLPLTASQIIDDLRYLLNTYDINGISFYDSNFTIDKKRVFDFCALVVKLQLAFKWAAAVDLYFLRQLNDEEWQMLKKAGCVRLLIGAESGCKEVLKLIGKSFEPDDVIAVAKKSVEYGISIYFTMIVGWPETFDEDFALTKELIEKIRKETKDHEFIIHVYAPFMGTPLFNYACRFGYVPPKSLEEWAKYDYYKITTPWITNEYLSKVEKYRMELSISYQMHQSRKLIRKG
jgi:radical SAM superfamily enzyme YgiQ (UPF0313 family)